MEKVESRRERLLEKANQLPLTPGVYIMKDASGKVIYVGKSRKLKNRVSQYFQNSEKNLKTSRMAGAVYDFDHYLCDNEMEALSLENTLIKQYTPKYNIRLKDAKSYPYIKLTVGEEYPRLRFTRRRDGDKAKYFGPYSGSGIAYSLMDLVNKTLRLPTCKLEFPRDIGKKRPCLYYQLGQCCGVCTGKVPADEYRELVKNASDLLTGKTAGTKGYLEAQMMKYAAEERFEAAAKCRDTITALSRIREKQKVVADPATEQDVVALYADDSCSAVSVFYIRSGVLQDKSDFVWGAERILEVEDMTAFLWEHYHTREYIPPKILLAYDCPDEDAEMLSSMLSDLAGRRVKVLTPERGTSHALCEMVEKNAREAAGQYRFETEKRDGTSKRLAELLGLPKIPHRIESYDISNFGKEQLTAGMVVMKDGKLSKGDYRTFKIRTVEGTDDYASMREALARRLMHLQDDSGSFSELPDLILLDGGRGHVAVIRELMRDLELEIPVFGMVKDDYHKTRALCSDSADVNIAKEQDVFLMIYKLQEEVHRFTVGRMTNAKRKTLKTSVLTSIPGIGESKAKKLLGALGSLSAVRGASVSELSGIPGISQKDAKSVYDYYHSSETPEENLEEGSL